MIFRMFMKYIALRLVAVVTFLRPRGLLKSAYWFQYGAIPESEQYQSKKIVCKKWKNTKCQFCISLTTSDWAIQRSHSHIELLSLRAARYLTSSKSTELMNSPQNEFINSVDSEEVRWRAALKLKSSICECYLWIAQSDVVKEIQNWHLVVFFIFYILFFYSGIALTLVLPRTAIHMQI